MITLNESDVSVVSETETHNVARLWPTSMGGVLSEAPPEDCLLDEPIAEIHYETRYELCGWSPVNLGFGPADCVFLRGKKWFCLETWFISSLDKTRYHFKLVLFESISPPLRRGF